MNTNLFSKSNFKTTTKALIGAGLLSFAASVSAFDDDTAYNNTFENNTASNVKMEPVTCENGKNYAEIFHEMQPFLDVDHEKALSQLPDAEAKKLLIIENKLKHLEGQFESLENIDEKQEIALLKLADEAADIIERNGIMFEDVNRLDSLSESQKEKAIATWCEIAEKIEQQSDKEAEIDTLFLKLDNVLMNSKSK